MSNVTPDIIHFPSPISGKTACTLSGTVTILTNDDPGRVTCFACRKTPPFKKAQDNVPPVKLSGVMADDDYLAALADQAKERFDLEDMRNERGMFVIEEFIHHGNYRSTRRVEVYALNETTVDAVLQSSAYCYGSWASPGRGEEQFATHRRAALGQLVHDLKHGQVNRSIGWSTFQLLHPHQ